MSVMTPDFSRVIAVEPSAVVAAPSSNRLTSLDVFRGIVILAMLLVNNIGDPETVGYFWKHADWHSRPLIEDLRDWWQQLHITGWTAIFDFSLLRNCTLADYVMPMFMLIIGIAIPFAAAAARRKGNVGASYWLGVVRRGLTIFALGWCIDLSLTLLNWHFNPDAAAKLTFVLGMNVLQLLGISFILTRLLYILPTKPRLAAAALLFIAHWAMLRFVPQGVMPAGTFTEEHNAAGYLYNSLSIFRSISIFSWLTFNIVGMLSVPPAVATMTLGTWMGQMLRDANMNSTAKIHRLVAMGFTLAIIGIAWSCDLPMNKPRWTPCYLVYCAGVGCLCIALLYWLIDVRRLRGWTWPFVALGVNAIGIYFLSIMAKIWLLNMPRVTYSDGSVHFLTSYLINTLQHATSPTAGSWLFTCTYIGVIWFVATMAYRKRLIWKV